MTKTMTAHLSGVHSSMRIEWVEGNLHLTTWFREDHLRLKSWCRQALGKSHGSLTHGKWVVGQSDGFGFRIIIAKPSRELETLIKLMWSG